MCFFHTKIGEKRVPYLIEIETFVGGLRGQLCRLRRAESSLKRRKEKAVKWAQFIKDPYGFTKTLLGEARSGRLTSPKEVVEEFLKESHSDALRNQACGVHPKISRTAETPEEELDTSEPTWREVQDIESPFSICPRTKRYTL